MAVAKPTFFFYDLETSGLSPKHHRIMQFAGQRTDMDLNPIGEPINILVKLTPDVLPDPYAVMVTGITPQKTHEEGYTEADFLKILHDEVFAPNTIIVGYNNVRFDDEFMRHTLYRNFYDPYEWAWREDRSRWDLLDVIRITRALRPGDINWPFTDEGKPTNRLELLSKHNNLSHDRAHDALSDVIALIEVAKLLKTKQPKLFDFMLKNRSKHAVAGIVDASRAEPFVYTSGRYPSEHLHTTVALPLFAGETNGTVVVWDLRHDPREWLNKSADELIKIRYANWEERKNPDFVSLPAKELNITRCPAVAPTVVLDADTKTRLAIDESVIKQNLRLVMQNTQLIDLLRQAFAPKNWPKTADVDHALYDGFLNDSDKTKLSAVRAANANELADFNPNFSDERLPELLLRYKARNFINSLSADEREKWDNFVNQKITKALPGYMTQLQNLYKSASDEQKFLLNELQLWAESVAPISD